MKTIYLGDDFKCHVSDDGTRTAVETDIFDGKCDAFVEGFRFVPKGQTWIRTDGTVFPGEMLAPWKDFSELDACQRSYEQQLMRENEEILESLMGGVKDVQQE